MTIRPHMQVIYGIRTLRVRRGRVIDPRYQPSQETLRTVGRLEAWLWQECDVPLLPLQGELVALPCRSEEIEANQAATLGRFLSDEDGRPRRGNQVLYWNTERASPRLIGFKLPDTIFANDVLWALVSRHPAYQRTGAHLLPSAPLAPFYERALRQFRSGARNPRSEPKIFHTVNRAKILARNGQHYPYFEDLVPDYLVVTSWLFAWVGLRVRRRDLRLMLSVVWN